MACFTYALHRAVLMATPSLCKHIHWDLKYLYRIFENICIVSIGNWRASFPAVYFLLYVLFQKQKGGEKNCPPLPSPPHQIPSILWPFLFVWWSIRKYPKWCFVWNELIQMTSWWKHNLETFVCWYIYWRFFLNMKHGSSISSLLFLCFNGLSPQLSCAAIGSCARPIEPHCCALVIYRYT